MSPGLTAGAGAGVAGVAVALALAGLDWLAVARRNALLERWAKPAVPGALIVAALAAAGPDGITRALLVAALAASLVGDWLLLPPVRFVPGLVAFLAAHLAYLGLFVRLPLEAGPAVGGLGLAVVLLAVVGLRIVRAATVSGLGAPVAVYLGAILAMAVTATATGLPSAAVGAWLFVVSDAVLGWDRFVAPPAPDVTAAVRRRLAVIVPYHAAQVCLVLAALLTFPGSPA